MPRHPLILDGSPTPDAFTTGHQNCACTFYLVFKEPAFCAPHYRRPNRRQGNLTSINGIPWAVNCFFDASERCCNRGRTDRKGRALGDRTHKKFAPHTEPGANRPTHQGRGTLSPSTIRSGPNGVNLGPSDRFVTSRAQDRGLRPAGVRSPARPPTRRHAL
jgi:hypothetical protein